MCLSLPLQAATTRATTATASTDTCFSFTNWDLLLGSGNANIVYHARRWSLQLGVCLAGLCTRTASFEMEFKHKWTSTVQFVVVFIVVVGVVVGNAT